jgi:hypothetical protein
LCRRICRNQPGEPANRAGRNTRKASSRQHDDLPSLSGSPVPGLLSAIIIGSGLRRHAPPSIQNTGEHHSGFAKARG